MRNQQQAEREEQQRIKNLVLNYEIRENEDQEGWGFFEFPVQIVGANSFLVGYEKPANFHYNKKQGKDRGGQRVRKLQLSDVEWYVPVLSPYDESRARTLLASASFPTLGRHLWFISLCACPPWMKTDGQCLHLGRERRAPWYHRQSLQTGVGEPQPWYSSWWTESTQGCTRSATA